jgi:hypothetical protein
MVGKTQNSIEVDAKSCEPTMGGNSVLPKAMPGEKASIPRR